MSGGRYVQSALAMRPSDGDQTDDVPEFERLLRASLKVVDLLGAVQQSSAGGKQVGQGTLPVDEYAAEQKVHQSLKLEEDTLDEELSAHASTQPSAIHDS